MSSMASETAGCTASPEASTDSASREMGAISGTVVPEIAGRAIPVGRDSLATPAEDSEDFAVRLISRALNADRDAAAREVVSGGAPAPLTAVGAQQTSPADRELRDGNPDHGPAGVQRSAAEDTAEPPRLKRRASSWQLLSQRDFRLYFFGSLASNLGTWLQSTAQVLIAYRLTHSVFAVGLIVSAQFSGMVIVSPWAAVLVTRLSPRAVLIATQFASAVIAILMAWRYLNGALGLHTLVVGALGLGFAYALALPVQTALVPSLVAKTDMADALRMNSVSYNAARALAPALSVLVIASLGPDIIFILNALSFILFIALLRRLPRIAHDTSLRTTLAHLFHHARRAASTTLPPVIRTPAPSRLSPGAAAPAAITAHPGGPPLIGPGQQESVAARPSPPPVTGPRARVTDGLVIALRHRRILLLLAIVAAVTLADDPVLVLSPALAHVRFHISGAWSGYFIAALGWGSVAGTLTPTSARYQGAQSASRYAAFSLLALGVSVVVFAAGFSPLTSLAAAIAAGAAGLFTGTAAQSALLRHQKDTAASVATVASVAALWAIAWAGTKPFASLIDGWLATHAGMLSASLALAAPAVTIALCELLLPRNVKATINSAAEDITRKVPGSIRTARAFLRSRRSQVPRFRLRLPDNLDLPDQAHSVASGIVRHFLLLGTDEFAGSHIVTSKTIAPDEAPVAQEAASARIFAAALSETS